MVSVSTLHHKVKKFSSGTGSPRWSWKKGHKTVAVVWWYAIKKLFTHLTTLPYLTFRMSSPVKEYSVLRYYEIDPVCIPDVTKVTKTSEKLVQTEVGLMVIIIISLFITFCVSCRRRKMYCGHACLCVCLSASVRPHYCMDPDVTWGRGRGCP